MNLSAGGIASKKFLFDMGFTNFFINHCATVEWADRTHAGNLVFPKLQENFVCNEIVAMSEAPYTILNYYKETRNSREIDFVMPFGNGVVPIEVKSTSSISRNALIPMISFLEHAKLITGILAYNGTMKELMIRKKKIYAMPAYMISELPRLLTSNN